MYDQSVVPVNSEKYHTHGYTVYFMYRDNKACDFIPSIENTVEFLLGSYMTWRWKIWLRSIKAAKKRNCFIDY